MALGNRETKRVEDDFKKIAQLLAESLVQGFYNRVVQAMSGAVSETQGEVDDVAQREVLEQIKPVTDLRLYIAARIKNAIDGLDISEEEKENLHTQSDAADQKFEKGDFIGGYKDYLNLIGNAHFSKKTKVDLLKGIDGDIHNAVHGVLPKSILARTFLGTFRVLTYISGVALAHGVVKRVSAPLFARDPKKLIDEMIGIAGNVAKEIGQEALNNLGEKIEEVITEGEEKEVEAEKTISGAHPSVEDLPPPPPLDNIELPPPPEGMVQTSIGEKEQIAVLKAELAELKEELQSIKEFGAPPPPPSDSFVSDVPPPPPPPSDSFVSDVPPPPPPPSDSFVSDVPPPPPPPSDVSVSDVPPSPGASVSEVSPPPVQAKEKPPEEDLLAQIRAGKTLKKVEKEEVPQKKEDELASLQAKVNELIKQRRAAGGWSDDDEPSDEWEAPDAEKAAAEARETTKKDQKTTDVIEVDPSEYRETFVKTGPGSSSASSGKRKKQGKGKEEKKEEQSGEEERTGTRQKK